MNENQSHVTENKDENVITYKYAHKKTNTNKLIWYIGQQVTFDFTGACNANITHPSNI